MMPWINHVPVEHVGISADEAGQSNLIRNANGVSGYRRRELPGISSRSGCAPTKIDQSRLNHLIVAHLSHPLVSQELLKVIDV